MRIDIEQLEFVDKTLREILVNVEAITGAEFTITSLYRIGDSGVHGQLPVRGCDLRCRNPDIGLQLERLINHCYQYDNTRLEKRCAILHGEGANLHLHIQTHPNTRLRDGS